MNKAKRQFLLTGTSSDTSTLGYRWERGLATRYSGGCWAIQDGPAHPNAVPTVHFFTTTDARAKWISMNVGRRHAVGVRNPLVKAFRRAMEGKQ